MLESISLKFTENEELVIDPAQGVIVFVGPNNSGKSLILRELETAISGGNIAVSKLLNDFEIIWPSPQQLATDISDLSKKAPPGTSPEHVFVGGFSPSGHLEAGSVPREALETVFLQRSQKRWVCSQFLKYFLIRLDGRTRFVLTDDRNRGDLLLRAENVLAHIFKDDKLRRAISDIVHDAFGVYLTIDALSQQDLRIRLSDTAPSGDEQNLNEAARIFHAKARHIKEASDGVQAFIGILCAVLSGDYRAILIDEPEAFLHPPLARKLGYQLTSELKSERCLMASTHSADFLIGCLQASPHVRVVRLEYLNGKSKGHIVESSVLTKFFKTPLLRSANVISALFHDGVVVTESDNDRAFYSEIYFRLAEQEKRYPSILFINAQNKQTIRDIIGPLRAFGVPAAAIVDIDILKDGGQTWLGWLSSAQVPEALRSGFSVQRGDLCQRFSKIVGDMKTNGGVDALLDPDKQAANQLFDILDDYGIFVVRKGELENWLESLSVLGKKTDWTVSVLEKMGSDPANADYVKPTQGDVWDFMRSIVSWIKNSARKGTA